MTPERKRAEPDFVWRPPSDYVERANVTRLMRRHGIDDYRTLVTRSVEDIEWFWNEVVDDLGIEFFSPYSRVLDDSEGPAWPKWFVGGTVNLTHNCIDRHAHVSPHARAIMWEGEDGAVRAITYAELLSEVCKVANGLLELGIGPGDAVGVYMPMVPEAVIAAYAIARIGAVYLPIFSGFGPPAIATRLHDAGAKAMFVADGFLRRGARVPMLETARAARALSPSVDHLFVFPRFDEPVELEDGEKTWADAFGNRSPEHDPPALDPETPVMLAYTSGTTGQPKGSVHVHGGLLVKLAA